MRLGIIGNGRIAARFVSDARLVEGVEIIAVYNPKIKSAEIFAKNNNIPSGYDSLRDFLNVVEGVYIASPHQTHFEYIMAALKADKHVLCEKPMCLSEGQVRKVYSLANERGLILREALKTSYFEGFNKIIEIARSGVIGDIVDIESAFTKLERDTTRELTDTEFGGSVTELGSYVLLPILRLLGCDYRDVDYRSIYADNGLDLYTKIYLGYDSAMATAKVGLGVKSEGQLLISGTTGYILAQSPWWLTRRFEVRYEDVSKTEIYEFAPWEGSGLQFELSEFVGADKQVSCSHERRDKESELLGSETQSRKDTYISEAESIAMAAIIEKYLKNRTIER